MTLSSARIWSIAIAALCALLLKATAPGLFTGMDNWAGEAVWRIGGAGEERRVVIVDIDEASLARIGPWPWPRDRMAELLSKLAAMETGPVLFDVVFPDAQPGDSRFAAELARSPAVLAQIFSLRPGNSVAAGKIQGALDSPKCGPPFPEAEGYIGNAQSLVTTTGHITPRIDSDGAVRRIPAVICHDGVAYPALGLAALLRAANLDSHLQLAEGSSWLEPAWWLFHPMLPGIKLPLDENGDTRLSYQLPRSAFVSVSASDILEGRAPSHIFRNAWVLVGATAFGLGDVVPTPHGGAVGGVEVHAQFISALLDSRLPHTPRAAALIAILLAVSSTALLLAIAVAARRKAHVPPLSSNSQALSLPVWGLPLIAIAIAMLLLLLHSTLLLTHHLWLGWAGPATFVLFAGLLLAAVEHAHTRFERERLFTNLISYLPEPVAREIAFNKISGSIQAERREVTILFADIRNFSAYCEGRPPEETAILLHGFFTVAARIVEQHGGFIEEYAGDAVMAVWNSHSSDTGHCSHAYAAAQALIRECAPLFPDPPPPGLEPLALGIGLECGDALVGSFGPAGRRTHTVLGETVTIASRLTALTGDLAYPILIGEKAGQSLAHAKLVSLGEFLLEGMRRPRRIYAPSSEQTPVLTLVRSDHRQSAQA